MILTKTDMVIMPHDCTCCDMDICFYARATGGRPENCPLVEADENVLRAMGVVIQNERDAANEYLYGERRESNAEQERNMGL